jgi:hypothetical protein
MKNIIRKVPRYAKIILIIVLIVALMSIYFLNRSLFSLTDKEILNRSSEIKTYFNNNKSQLERIAVYLEENSGLFKTKPVYFSSMTVDVEKIPDLTIRREINNLVNQGGIKSIVFGSDNRIRFVLKPNDRPEKEQPEGEYLQQLCYTKDIYENTPGSKIVRNEHGLIRRYEKLAEHWCEYVYALYDASGYRLAAWNFYNATEQKHIITDWSKAVVRLTDRAEGEFENKDRDIVVCVLLNWENRGQYYPILMYFDPETLELIGAPATI